MFEEFEALKGKGQVAYVFVWQTKFDEDLKMDLCYLNGFCLLGKRHLKENKLNSATMRCQKYPPYDKRGGEIFYIFIWLCQICDFLHWELVKICSAFSIGS